jgi:hypothetical protein
MRPDNGDISVQSHRRSRLVDERILDTMIQFAIAAVNSDARNRA